MKFLTLTKVAAALVTLGLLETLTFAAEERSKGEMASARLLSEQRQIYIDGHITNHRMLPAAIPTDADDDDAAAVNVQQDDDFSAYDDDSDYGTDKKRQNDLPPINPPKKPPVAADDDSVPVKGKPKPKPKVEDDDSTGNFPVAADDDSDSYRIPPSKTPDKGPQKISGGSGAGSGVKVTPKPRAQNVICMEKTKEYDIIVDDYNDDDQGRCDIQGSEVCNLRAAFKMIGNQEGTIRLPTLEAHRLTLGPIEISDCARITVISESKVNKNDAKALITVVSGKLYDSGNLGALTVGQKVELNMENIAFKNGVKRGLYAYNSALNLQGVQFLNNTHDEEGASVKIELGSLICTGCTFFNNSAGMSSAGVYAMNSDVVISGSKFLNNTAVSGTCIKAYGGQVDLRNTELSYNLARNDGAGMEIIQSKGNVENVIMKANHANNGGAIKLSGSNVTFQGNNFFGNEATNGGGAVNAYLSEMYFLENSFFNNTGKQAGAIYLLGSNATSLKNNFKYNEAREETGGAFDVLESYLDTTSDTFSENFAPAGSNLNLASGAVVTVASANMISSKREMNSDEITCSGATLRIVSSVFKGPGPDTSAASTSFFKSEIKTKSVVADSRLFSSEGCDISFSDAVVEGFIAENGGAGKGFNTTLNAVDSVFRYNRGKKLAGVFHMEFSNIILSNTTFFNNSALDFGGALYVSNSHLDWKGAMFVQNYASMAGGAVALYDCKDVAGTTLISGSIFKDNYLSYFGGSGMYIEGSVVTIDSSVFTNNTESTLGAALQANSSTLNITGSRFNSNAANNGGAISLFASNATMTDCSLEKNTAVRNGGAISVVSSRVQIIDSEFENNVAKRDAGAIFASDSHLVLEYANLKSNKAQNGGAVYVVDGNVEYIGSSFSANQARKGSNSFADQSDVNVYCTYIDGISSRGGHKSQECYKCFPGQYGEFMDVGSSQCAQYCGATQETIDCFSCPFEGACEGGLTCASGYKGELCMECSSVYSVRIREHCINVFVLGACGLGGLAVFIALLFYMTYGKPLDDQNFLRAKIFTGMIQMIVITTLVPNTWPFFVEVVGIFLQPFGLWIEFDVVKGLLSRVIPGAADFYIFQFFNVAVPVVVCYGLIRLAYGTYSHRITALKGGDAEASEKALLKERKYSQLAVLLLQNSVAPMILNLSKIFRCTETPYHGNVLIVDLEVQCSGFGYWFTFSVSVLAIMLLLVGIVAAYRHIRSTYCKDQTIFQMYIAFYETYDASSYYFDFVSLLFKVLMVVPLLVTRRPGAQVTLFMAIMIVYYVYIKRGVHFIKYNLEPSDLHHSNEMSKVALVMYNSVLVFLSLSSSDEKTYIIAGFAAAVVNVATVVLSMNTIYEDWIASSAQSSAQISAVEEQKPSAQ